VHCDGSSAERQRAVSDEHALEGFRYRERVKRSGIRHDATTAKTPFQYHGSALAQVRPDQVPRVLAALTEADELPTKELPFDALIARAS
jgi:hypothetical protein